ncbi:MAG: polyhydroxyalkanoate synthesis regulator DNA-binding domain-containing protein [Myxococcales bacterium]|nr:polyhydroxyalkanoate synthesis regulator DNA-binding domain-containing protein [Myxococcales bacterium]
MSGPRTIKRYANRKLYDTRDSRYVTLDQISEMIRKGEDVKVVDNSTKEDLTSVTLAQILFEEEKRKRSFLPLPALRKIIQSGGQQMTGLVTQISELPARVFKRGDKQESAASESDGGEQPAAPASAPPSAGNDSSAVAETPADEHHDPQGMVREFIDSVQTTIDGWQKRIDANIQGALESMSPLAPLQKEIGALRERIGELEQKLVEVQRVAGAPKAD